MGGICSTPTRQPQATYIYHRKPRKLRKKRLYRSRQIRLRSMRVKHILNNQTYNSTYLGWNEQARVSSPVPSVFSIPGMSPFIRHSQLRVINVSPPPTSTSTERCGVSLDWPESGGINIKGGSVDANVEFVGWQCCCSKLCGEQ